MKLDYGKPHIGGHPKFVFDMKKMAKQYQDEGMSLRHLAQIYGVSAWTIADRLHKVGISTKKPIAAVKNK